jgi:hypothetical protein
VAEKLNITKSRFRSNNSLHTVTEFTIQAKTAIAFEEIRTNLVAHASFDVCGERLEAEQRAAAKLARECCDNVRAVSAFPFYPLPISFS